MARRDPPPNPARANDARFEDYRRRFGDESWELDALEPMLLVGLVEDRVRVLRDDVVWAEDVERERAEIEELSKISENWDEVVEYVR